MGAKKADGKSVKAGKPPGFEKALQRLETIVAEMEEGALGLEQMIARFEEGQSLVKFCTGKLNEVERKIEVLVKQGDSISAEPLDVADETGGDAGTPEPSETDTRARSRKRQGPDGTDAELF